MDMITTGLLLRLIRDIMSKSLPGPIVISRLTVLFKRSLMLQARDTLVGERLSVGTAADLLHLPPRSLRSCRRVLVGAELDSVLLDPDHEAAHQKMRMWMRMGGVQMHRR